MKFLRLYPIVLIISAVGGFALCEWFHAHDLASREPLGDLSFKYFFTSGPQLAAALLLLGYACTFARRNSAFAHQLMAESCVHQALVALLGGAVLHSGFHMTHSACCAFPALCPVDVAACELREIFPCPQRVEHMPHYDVRFRLAQVIATCVILVAMTSIAPIHRIKHLLSRTRRAELLTCEFPTRVFPPTA